MSKIEYQNAHLRKRKMWKGWKEKMGGGNTHHIRTDLPRSDSIKAYRINRCNLHDRAKNQHRRGHLECLMCDEG